MLDRLNDRTNASRPVGRSVGRRARRLALFARRTIANIKPRRMRRTYSLASHFFGLARRNAQKSSRAAPFRLWVLAKFITDRFCARAPPTIMMILAAEARPRGAQVDCFQMNDAKCVSRVAGATPLEPAPLNSRRSALSGRPRILQRKPTK